MTGPLSTDDQGRLLVDVRGPRFSAAITAFVLGVALVLRGPVGIGLVAWQWLAFAVATFGGLRWSVYGNLFRALKRRLDLGAPPATEPEGPPRFAQLCGLLVVTLALALFALGMATAGWIAVAIVFGLSALLAVAGVCVGCELYLLGQRLRPQGRRSTAATVPDVAQPRESSEPS